MVYMVLITHTHTHRETFLSCRQNKNLNSEACQLVRGYFNNLIQFNNRMVGEVHQFKTTNDFQ